MMTQMMFSIPQLHIQVGLFRRYKLGLGSPSEYPSDANDEMDTSLPHKAYEWNEDSENWELLHTTICSETEEWELEE